MNIKNPQLDLNNYDIWYVPFWKTKNFYIFVLITGLIFLTCLIYFLFRLYKNYNIKKISAIDKFYLDIDLLNKKSNSNSKNFYSSLIVAFKNYLALSYGYNFIKNTDDELISSLKFYSLPENLFSNLALILHNAQISKFSNAQISENQMSQDLIDLKAIVLTIESIQSNNEKAEKQDI